MIKRYLIIIACVCACALAYAQEDTIANATTAEAVETAVATTVDATAAIISEDDETDKSIVERVTKWYGAHMNYATITALMTVESSFIPFPSEVVVPPAAYVANDPESPLHTTGSYPLNVCIIVLFASLGAMLGALPGKFSVSASKQVQFSRGNLWSNPTVTPQTWSFENDQFSCAPSASGYYVNNHISHFYWEATGNYGTGEKCVTSTGSKSDVLDWGVPFCSANNFATGTWYTLSLEEWKYILNSRSGNRFAKAVVKDLKGLILFPDSYTGTATGAGLAAVNNDEAEFPQTSMSAATWSAMEAAGCVFLPATGFRVYHIFASACVVADVNVGCRYWSATASDSSEGWAYDIAVNDISIAYFGNGSREEGMAVRLVCPIQ